MNFISARKWQVFQSCGHQSGCEKILCLVSAIWQLDLCTGTKTAFASRTDLSSSSSLSQPSWHICCDATWWMWWAERPGWQINNWRRDRLTSSPCIWLLFLFIREKERMHEERRPLTFIHVHSIAFNSPASWRCHYFLVSTISDSWSRITALMLMVLSVSFKHIKLYKKLMWFFSQQNHTEIHNYLVTN